VRTGEDHEANLGIASDYVESDDVLVIVWDGQVSGAEWKHNVGEQLEDDPAWPRGRRRLIDLTTLDPSEITVSDIEVVIAFGRERIHYVAGRRQAVVAVLAWDLAQEFARRSTELGATTIVFDRLEPACAWLGVDPATARPVARELRAGLRARDSARS
jgi:hypothetical protein